MPDVIPQQDWMWLNHASDSFKRNRPPPNSKNTFSVRTQLPLPGTTTSAGGASSSQRTLELNADDIDDILAATRAMPSWKASQIEGTNWTGTLEENMSLLSVYKISDLLDVLVRTFGLQSFDMHVTFSIHYISVSVGGEGGHSSHLTWAPLPYNSSYRC